MFGHSYRYLFILLLAIYSYLNILFTEGDKLFGFTPSPVLFFGIIFVMVFLIWEGNRLISKLIRPTRTAWHQLLKFYLFSLVMVTVISLGITLFIHLTQHISADTLLTLKLSLGFAFRFNLFLPFFNSIVFFF